MYSKSSSGNTITFALSNLETVAVLLKVPAVSDLNITTNSDAITVIGVTGQQMLDSNARNLNASQDTLMSKSTLDTNGGAITFSGTLDPQSTDQFAQLEVDSNGGAIQLNKAA